VSVPATFWNTARTFFTGALDDFMYPAVCSGSGLITVGKANLETATTLRRLFFSDLAVSGNFDLRKQAEICPGRSHEAADDPARIRAS
jgi:hypothetical protein